jgi:hypothetical protein
MTEQAVPRITQRSPVPTGDPAPQAQTADDPTSDPRVLRALAALREKKDAQKRLEAEIGELNKLLAPLMGTTRVPMTTSDGRDYRTYVVKATVTGFDADRLLVLDPAAWEKATVRKPVTADEFARLIEAGEIPRDVAQQVIRQKPKTPHVRFDPIEKENTDD